MNENKENYTAGAASGIGIGDILFLIFLVLKLCKVIDWPWIWVLSPIWITCILVFLLYFMVWLKIRRGK